MSTENPNPNPKLADWVIFDRLRCVSNKYKSG